MLKSANAHIRNLVKKLPIGSRLPTNRELARELGMSSSSVQQAYRALLGEKKITRVRKRGTFVGPPELVHELWKNEPLQTQRPLLDIMSERIELGFYRGGESMPVLKSIVAEFSVSKSTVSDVYRTLRNRGFIYKKGRNHIVGRPRLEVKLSSASLLFLTPNPFAQFSSVLSPLRAPFHLSMFDVLQCASVAIRKIVLPIDVPNMKLSAQLVKLRQTISSGPGNISGISYFGSNQSAAYNAQIAAAIDDLGVPFVTYISEAGAVPKIPNRNGLLFVSREEDLCDCLITAMESLGHKRIAFIALEEKPWIEARYQVLQQTVSTRIPGGSLTRITPRTVFSGALEFLQQYCPGEDLKTWFADANVWLPAMAGSPFHNHLSNKKQAIPGYVGSIVKKELASGAFALDNRFFIYTSYFLAKLVAEETVTAVIFANDETGATFDPVWQLAGFGIPRDFSLFAFDNYPMYIGGLSATVDRGAAAAGYSAAHYLLRDLPISLHPGSVIPTNPRFIPRTGIASPRTRPLSNAGPFKSMLV